jgi:hypothetical protein
MKFWPTIVALVVWPAMAGADPLVIDSFESGAFSHVSSGSTGSITQVGLPDVLGGKRNTTALKYQPATLVATLNLTEDDDGIRTVNQPSALPVGLAFNSVEVAYGSGLSGFGLGANFSAGGNDRFAVTFSEAPSNGKVHLDVISTGGIADILFPVTGPGTYYIPFSSLHPVGVSSYDFSRVDLTSLQFRFANDGLPAAVTLSDYRVVPEPASLTAAAVLAGAMASRGRRRGSR